MTNRSTGDLAVAPAGDANGTPLLALDRDYRVVGADFRARTEFGLTQERLDGGLSLFGTRGRISSVRLIEERARPCAAR